MMMIGADPSSNAHGTTKRMMDADQSSNAQSITTFPTRLYQMLEEADKGGFGDIVSWLPDGNGFIVHDREQFTSHVMKTFFSHTKWKSFLRQLNLYNFERLSKRGPGQGSCYSHPFLIRGEVDLCKQIHRSTTTGTATKAIPHQIFDKSLIEELYFRKQNNKKRATPPGGTAASTTYKNSPSSSPEAVLKDGIRSITLLHTIMEKPFHYGGVVRRAVGLVARTDTKPSYHLAQSCHENGESQQATVVENNDDPATILFADIHEVDDRRGADQKTEAVFLHRQSSRKNQHIMQESHQQDEDESFIRGNYKHPGYKHMKHFDKEDSDDFSSQQEEEELHCDSSLSSPKGTTSTTRKTTKPLLSSYSPSNPMSHAKIGTSCTKPQDFVDVQWRQLLEFRGNFPDDIADAIISIFGTSPIDVAAV